MTNLEDLMAYVRDNLSRVLGLGMLVLITVGVAIFAAIRILPAVQDNRLLTSQLSDARAMLAQQAQAQQGAPSALQGQLDKMQGKLSDQAGVFLTEAEVAAVLNNLYLYADQSGVQIAQMEAQLAPLSETPEAVVVHEIQVFQLAVSGDIPQLIDFVIHIREAATPGVAIDELKIEPDDETKEGEIDILTMNILFYTSPYASGSALAEAPGTTQTVLSLLVATKTPTFDPAPDLVLDAASTLLPGEPTPTLDPAFTLSEPSSTPTAAAPGADVEALVQEINQAWAEQNWPGVIGFASQVLARTPEYEGVKIKLYTAHLNYGYLLVGEAKYPEAEQQFNQALEIMPNSSAALAGLQMLKEREESGNIVYLVRWGDTLTVIARRFNTTIQAIEEANKLTSDRIYAGQELRIPQ